MSTIKELQNEIHQTAVDHGFWEASSDIPTKLMLIVSELAEALEEYREDRMSVWRKRFVDEDGVPQLHVKPEGFPIEIADAAIRIFDLTAYLGIDLEAVMRLKMDYNQGREHLHGGRKV